MRNKLSLSLIVVLALLSAQVTQAGQQVELRWKFEPGLSLAYRMTMTNETEMPNNMGVMVMEQIMSNRWEVLDVDDEGDATVQVWTDRVQMHMQSPMGNMDIDSAGDSSSDPTGGMLSAMAGTTYTLVFDAAGKIKEVHGLEEMREKLMAATGQAANPVVQQAFEQMASEDGIKNMMEQGFASWPQEPVSPGDSWDAGFDMTMPMIGTMVYDMSLTLDRVEERDGRSIAIIDSSGTIAITPDNSPDNPAAGMMEISNATIAGTMEWDVAAGHLLRTTQDTTMEMSIAAGGQQMTMMTFSNMVMELVEGQ
jgi:hypothetical protein